MSALKYQHLALHALGDATRRVIFERLGGGPLSVAHLAEGLPVSRPAVSQHLKVLCEAKLVSMQKAGTRSIYRIENEGLAAIRAYLDRFWDEALQNFKVLAEEAERAKTAHSGAAGKGGTTAKAAHPKKSKSKKR